MAIYPGAIRSRVAHALTLVRPLDRRAIVAVAAVAYFIRHAVSDFVACFYVGHAVVGTVEAELLRELAPLNRVIERGVTNLCNAIVSFDASGLLEARG